MAATVGLAIACLIVARRVRSLLPSSRVRLVDISLWLVRCVSQFCNCTCGQFGLASRVVPSSTVRARSRLRAAPVSTPLSPLSADRGHRPFAYSTRKSRPRSWLSPEMFDTRPLVPAAICWLVCESDRTAAETGQCLCAARLGAATSPVLQVRSNVAISGQLYCFIDPLPTRDISGEPGDASWVRRSADR